MRCRKSNLHCCYFPRSWWIFSTPFFFLYLFYIRFYIKESKVRWNTWIINCTITFFIQHSIGFSVKNLSSFFIQLLFLPDNILFYDTVLRSLWWFSACLVCHVITPDLHGLKILLGWFLKLKYWKFTHGYRPWWCNLSFSSSVVRFSWFDKVAFKKYFNDK